MKSWKITYTEDKGASYKTITTEAETFTKAYVNATIKISKDGEITEVEEIKTTEE